MLPLFFGFSNDLTFTDNLDPQARSEAQRTATGINNRQ
jgi:hypothetical protein